MGLILAGVLLFGSPGQPLARAQSANSAGELGQVRAKADQGDLESLNVLGNVYTNALLGVKQDYAEALTWYRRAADKGFAPAQFNLGLAYELGRGVPADERQAFKHYLMAAEQGFAAAQFNVGNMYSAGRGVGQDLFEANLWYKQAGEKGVVEAQFNLGLAYEAGRGVKKDEMQAARWYKQAADHGFARAQYNLGLLLEDGRGVTKNETAAAIFYRAAAEQGFGAAQNNYGLMISEGRGGLTKDPVQAYMWFSLAAGNGSNPAARDFAAKALTADQLAAAQELLNDRKAGKPQPGAAAARPSSAPENSTAAARVAELTATLEKAARANAQFAEANQKLELEKARLELELSSRAAGSDSAKLVEQLREQNRRLSAQVQSLLVDKETAERDAKILAAQVKDAQEDLARAKSASASAPAPAAAKPTAGLVTDNSRYPAQNSDKDSIIVNLQRDNARLNDEVKRSTRELMSLNSQLRGLRNGAGSKPATDHAASVELRTENQRVGSDNDRLKSQRDAAVSDSENLAGQLREARSEITRLNQQIQLLGSTRQSSDAASDQLAQLNSKATQAQQTAAQLQQQVQTLQSEKADLEKWSQSLEKTINEKTAAAELTGTSAADLRAKLALAEKQLADRAASVGAQEQAMQKLTADNTALGERTRRAEEALAAKPVTKPATEDTGPLRQQLAEAQDRTEQMTREKQALTDKVTAEHSSYLQAQARVAALESDLRNAQKKPANTADLDGYKKQLAEANAALEKSGATVAELTATKERLEKETAAARQLSPDTVALRDENSRLHLAAEEASALKMKAEQLARDNDQLAGFMNSNRRDLNQAQTRVAELEKLLEEARTIHTRSGDDTAKLRTDLAEANQSIEKLNATVADLTGVNDRLEKDLENAKKSTAAALAAQSQAVTAAQPDAYKMEISTLQAHVKELEGQSEDERGNAAKEIATMAAQLARTRETNKSLTEANRALMNAKQAELPTVDKDEFDRLQSRVRDLTTVADETRRQNQKLSDDNQRFATERLTLKQQLEDARKVATVLPGLSDEKAALQERLEAVGAQLLKTQQEIDTLQKENADATSQVIASKQAAEKAQADFAALQGRTVEAEKTAEAHNASVAELTEANTKLETERNDLRRQLTTLKADNNRLTQAASSLEQLKTDADRSAQQNIDALTAQLAQSRRDLQSARDANSRLVEGNVSQERERAATLAQLHQQNSALAARLGQAQSTLDQIASAARLGTPAAALAAGNPAPIPIVSTAPAGTEARYHTVAEGDSLSRISLRYYGSANRWQEIYAANRDVLQGSNALRVGMQLRIP